MKKGMKKLISAILMILLLTPVLVSCQGNKDKYEKDVTPTSNQGTSDDVIDNSISEFEPVAGTDYGGYTFRILGGKPNSNIWGPYIIGSINEIAPEEEIGEPINDMIYKRNREVEKLYNIEIVPVYQTTDRGELANSALRNIMAGDDAYDVSLMVGSAMASILSSNSYTYDLFEVPNLDLTKSWWNQTLISELSIANQVRMITGDISVYSAFGLNMIFQNKEMVKLYELENAYDLVRQGKWTWEKMIEMCREVSRDLDGDGKMTKADSFGIFGEFGIMSFSVLSSGERITKKDKDDIPYLSINTENTIKALDYTLKSFLDKNLGMLSQDYRDYGDPYYELFLPKFQTNELLFMMDNMLSALELRSMDGDFGILPYPKLSEQQSQYYTTSNKWWDTYIFIPTSCKDIGRTGTILDALGYYSQKYVRPTIINTTVTNKLIRDDDSADMFDLLLNTRTYDLALLYLWGNLDWCLFRTTAQERANVFVTEYEKNVDVIKASMEKTINELLK